MSEKPQGITPFIKKCDNICNSRYEYAYSFNELFSSGLTVLPSASKSVSLWSPDWPQTCQFPSVGIIVIPCYIYKHALDSGFLEVVFLPFIFPQPTLSAHPIFWFLLLKLTSLGIILNYSSLGFPFFGLFNDYDMTDGLLPIHSSYLKN